MRRKLAALTGGLALVSAFTFAIPAGANAAAARESRPAASTRPADTNNGCGTLFDQGNHESSEINGDDGLEFGDGDVKFCNISTPLSGVFEMGFQEGTGQCLAVNSEVGAIDLDGASACSANGGEGDTWDRWTATEEGVINNTKIWEFKNQYNGDCMYDDAQDPAIYAACSVDEFEFFTWPGSDL
jgi:hypothetical protein